MPPPQNGELLPKTSRLTKSGKPSQFLMIVNSHRVGLGHL
jgi:hypothetical protein